MYFYILSECLKCDCATGFLLLVHHRVDTTGYQVTRCKLQRSVMSRMRSHYLSQSRIFMDFRNRNRIPMKARTAGAQSCISFSVTVVQILQTLPVCLSYSRETVRDDSKDNHED